MCCVAAIGVFCGSSSGTDPIFVETANELGSGIGTAGHSLVYGGGHVGLMGVVADAVLDAGGVVTGVMTEQLVAAEIAHGGLTSLVITASMHDRKARMAELSDGVIVLPGGFGTLDEAFEMITWNQLGLVAIPVVLLDVADYFASLFAFVDETVRTGFVSETNARLVQRATTPDEALSMATSSPEPFAAKWIG